MAINKSKTSPWMKTGIIILILAFVSSIGYASLGSCQTLLTTSQPSTTQPTATGSVEQINSQYKPGVDALTALVESQPTSYTALVNLGNAYFDWAQTLSSPSQNGSQATTAALTAAAPLWAQARDTYARALQVKSGESAVTVDYAITAFYSGDTTAAIAAAESVTKADPKFAQAYLNLGIFYASTGDAGKSIVAFQKNLELDPNGQNAAFVKEQIKTLQGAQQNSGSQP